MFGTFFRWLRPWIVGCGVLLVSAAGSRAEVPVENVPAWGAERYFVMIFGSESVPKRARYTHTWATIVRAIPDAMNAGAYHLESQTISWMPRTLNIRPLAFRAEPGVNLGLHATFRDCFSKSECVAMWGPYEFDAQHGAVIYSRVAAQIARLNSGCVLYKCIDPDHGPRSTYTCDCIHAVTDLDRNLPRPFYDEMQNFGMDAGRRVVHVLASRHRIDVQHTHPWIADALGVDPRVQRRGL
jgi:hypothetical protein